MNEAALCDWIRRTRQKIQADCIKNSHLGKHEAEVEVESSKFSTSWPHEVKLEAEAAFVSNSAMGPTMR